MTPPKGDLLRPLGLAYLGSLEHLSIYIFFYGVFVVLFSASVVIFVRKGFYTRATAVMFIATIVNFLLFSLNAGIQVSLFIVLIRKSLILDIDRPAPLAPKKQVLADNVFRSYHLDKLDIIYFWAASLPMLLSNLIVIWRAWALFRNQRRQWIILLPFILWIGAVGIAVGELIWLSNDQDGMNSNLAKCLMTAGIALSTATSAVTTLMTAYKLWSYRTFIVNTLDLGARKSPVRTVLIFLIESDLVYLVFQLVYLVLIAVYYPVTLETCVISAVYLSLCAMYPTVVMVLVETQFCPAASEARLTTLSFAVGPICTATDNRAESHCSPALQSQGGEGHGLERSYSK